MLLSQIFAAGKKQRGRKEEVGGVPENSVGLQRILGRAQPLSWISQWDQHTGYHERSNIFRTSTKHLP